MHPPAKAAITLKLKVPEELRKRRLRFREWRTRFWFRRWYLCLKTLIDYHTYDD